MLRELINSPKVTVVTLIYNTGNFVVESLECVKSQSYDNLQHIIIDDCSTDNSFNIVKDWIAKNNYECTLIQNKNNKGIVYNLNLALSLSIGKYICFISDDLWSKNKLHDQVSILENLPSDFAMLYSDFLTINEKGDIIKNSFIQSFFNNYNKIPSGEIFNQLACNFFTWIQTSLINLYILKKHFFKFPNNIISEDWYLALFLSTRYKIYFSNTISAYYRIRSDSVTREYWAAEKKIMVYKSHFLMFLKLLKSTQISYHKRKICYTQLRKYLFKIVSDDQCKLFAKLKFTLIYIFYTFDFTIYSKRFRQF